MLVIVAKSFQGTALNRSDLRAVSLNTCQMCVILSAPSSSDKIATGDPTLIDKEVILATLNVRAMRFSPAENANLEQANSAYMFFTYSYEYHILLQ